MIMLRVRHLKDQLIKHAHAHCMKCNSNIQQVSFGKITPRYINRIISDTNDQEVKHGGENVEKSTEETEKNTEATLEKGKKKKREDEEGDDVTPTNKKTRMGENKVERQTERKKKKKKDKKKKNESSKGSYSC